MGKLNFDVQWEHPGGARGRELRTTWARLRIDVAGETVTRVVDRGSNSMRDAVYGPVYPLAEWIAANWWSIFHEVASPSRASDNGYIKRHTLAAASEGFALPQMMFHPEGERIEVTWEPRDWPAARLHFLSKGRQYLPRDEVEDGLRRFVAGVVARLDDEGCGNTVLADEWRSIEASDPEELAFCRLAGGLGWDPLALSETDAAQILDAVQQIPPGIRDEFFVSAQGPQLVEQARVIRRFVDGAAADDLRIPSLAGLRSTCPLPTRGRPPWEQGCQLASWLRDQVHPEAPLLRSETDVGNALGVESQAWTRALQTGAENLTFLDAIVALTQADAPRFVLRPRPQRSRTFALCRALCEFLLRDSRVAIVAATFSERQKRNRAFAAEFLVPAAQLRPKIRVPTVTDEDIQDLAEEFGTSDLVIRHQIQNHGLAQIADWGR